VRIILGILHVQEAFGTSATGLVHDDERLLHQVVLDDHALDEASHLVSTTATTGRHDPFNRLGRLPGCAGHGRRTKRHGSGESGQSGSGFFTKLHSMILLGWVTGSPGQDAGLSDSVARFSGTSENRA